MIFKVLVKRFQLAREYAFRRCVVIGIIFFQRGAFCSDYDLDWKIEMVQEIAVIGDKRLFPVLVK